MLCAYLLAHGLDEAHELDEWWKERPLRWIGSSVVEHSDHRDEPGAHETTGADGNNSAEDAAPAERLADVERRPGAADAFDLTELREAYGHGVLTESDVAADPITQFRRWLEEALAGPIAEPNAMIVATADATGMPAARTVLLKGFDERGFVFYTNYHSDKGAELETNPRAALVFPWHAMERQVRVAGPATKVSPDESDAYFASRPWESRLGAIASPQSQVVTDRESLDAAYDALAQRWRDDPEIPRPEHWGGYRVAPQMVEFWQGRTGRLHDRLRYRAGEQGWILERLAP